MLNDVDDMAILDFPLPVNELHTRCLADLGVAE
jgi:hypothetical protein